ncbi:TetR/AcrR family transcriptional regulator [Microbacterium sp. XT11]|uniref:TetR/AcrR family transcriptional regulator n=1 Tax=Microbacterium sp. XT11 TaxID=367477 RepID=UPI000742D238|nr:TetR/AcrR family transcriptional regulator [Microbacterium sp. XT11]ALX65993.1 hypothetical protein AB663_000832 [Microbacterium sp. XT11]
MAQVSGAHRDALIQATVAEFAAAGYEGASLNRIIRAAGLSKSSFYHAVGSKAELFDAVVVALVDDVAAQWTAPDPAEFSGGRFWDQVDRTVAEFGDLAARNAALDLLGRIFYLPATGASDARTALLDDVRSWVERVLRQGVASGEVRDDLPVDLLAAAAFATLRAVDEWALGADGRADAVDGRADAVGVRADDAGVRADDAGVRADAAKRAPGVLLRGLLLPRP